MPNKGEIACAVLMLVWKVVRTPMLHPEVIPSIFETPQVRLVPWCISKIRKPLSDCIPRDSGEDLLQCRPLKSR
jgi:hypothetical protein